MTGIRVFTFVSTTDDLVDAFNVANEMPTGLRRILRWLVIAFGVFWLVGGIYKFALGPERMFGLLFAFIGAIMVWNYMLWPFLELREVRKSYPATQRVSLNFSAEGIDISAEGVGPFRKDWKTVLQFTRMRHGLLFRFNDGTTNWLPRRVFSSDAEMDEFAMSIENHVAAARPEHA